LSEQEDRRKQPIPTGSDVGAATVHPEVAEESAGVASSGFAKSTGSHTSREAGRMALGDIPGISDFLLESDVEPSPDTAIQATVSFARAVFERGAWLYALELEVAVGEFRRRIERSEVVHRLLDQRLHPARLSLLLEELVRAYAIELRHERREESLPDSRDGLIAGFRARVRGRAAAPERRRALRVIGDAVDAVVEAASERDRIAATLCRDLLQLRVTPRGLRRLMLPRRRARGSGRALATG